MHRQSITLMLFFLLLLAGIGCSLLSLAGLNLQPATATPYPSNTASQAAHQVEITAAQSQTAQPAVPALPTSLPSPSSTPTPVAVRFAVIGDYGQGDQNEADVANLVKSWDVDFIITVGDNNYPSGSAETIDQNIGQFYHEFIYPYRGAYGDGSDTLRFFPVLGNHDLDIDRAQAYYDYFELPGNERYYDFIQGPLHFFALNSDSREIDGVGRSSVQAEWLRERLAASNSAWKIVYGHHPPYTSGLRGPVDWMQWPFKEWGATAYLSGHDHFYERLEIDGLPYFINGIGGGPIYDIGFAAAGSIVRFNDDYGAMLVTATEQQISFQFITRSGSVVDEYTISKNQP